MPDSEGTVRDSLISVWRQTGEKPQELLNLIEKPPEIAFIYDVFLEISRGRQYFHTGIPFPIPHVEIAAWSSLVGIKLLPLELTLLRILDDEWRASQKGPSK